MTTVSEPIVIRYWINHYAAGFENGTFTDSDNPDQTGTIDDYGDAFIKKNIGAVIGEFEKGLRNLGMSREDAADRRKLILSFLFGDESVPIDRMSSKALMAGHVYGLKRWIGARKVDNKWLPRNGFVDELSWIASTARMIEDRSKRYNPIMSLGQVIAEVFPDIEKRAKKYPFEIEDAGMVSAGLQIGGHLTSINDDVTSFGPEEITILRPPAQRAEPVRVFVFDDNTLPVVGDVVIDPMELD